MYLINKVKKNILKLSLLISLIIILSFYHNTYKKMKRLFLLLVITFKIIMNMTSMEMEKMMNFL